MDLHNLTPARPCACANCEWTGDETEAAPLAEA